MFESQGGGLLPIRVTLNPKVGPEICIFMVDYTDFAYDLAEVKPFSLEVQSGIYKSSFGPVLFLFFSIRDPKNTEHFFTTFETFVNPNNSESLLSMNELSLQTHWHVFIIGPNNEELNWFEFPNLYNIHEAIEQLLVMVKSNPCQNFDLAKLEFQSKFTINDIPLGNR